VLALQRAPTVRADHSLSRISLGAPAERQAPGIKCRAPEESSKNEEKKKKTKKTKKKKKVAPL
jgi:hypothetical protein